MTNIIQQLGTPSSGRLPEYTRPFYYRDDEVVNVKFIKHYGDDRNLGSGTGTISSVNEFYLAVGEGNLPSLFPVPRISHAFDQLKATDDELDVLLLDRVNHALNLNFFNIDKYAVSCLKNPNLWKQFNGTLYSTVHTSAQELFMLEYAGEFFLPSMLLVEKQSVAGDIVLEIEYGGSVMERDGKLYTAPYQAYQLKSITMESGKIVVRLAHSDRVTNWKRIEPIVEWFSKRPQISFVKDQNARRVFYHLQQSRSSFKRNFS